MSNIYLVGFMGTGKSAVGRELAKKKKWRFVDLDELIELREGRCIADIFSKKGEPYFRRLEKKILAEVAGEDKFIVSCGGGVVTSEDNIKMMKKTGLIVCLKATPGVILRRTKQLAGCRPLLNVNNPKERIEFLLKLRAPYYAKAHKSINTSRLSVSQVAAGIIKLLKR
ncbi:MAG: Shikimate kinase [Candidatus Omnitrophica bacterium ADurb.Bin205]|nr:MAG: Shikimate kinase [Candidatus Omnitrophica bacterium ADurb.Bin205]